MGISLEDLKAYVAENCDRASFIQNWLSARGIDSNLIVIDGKKHILVQFDKRFYNPKFRIKTVVSHYDRVSGSPGANDNSAANLMIMDWCCRLNVLPSFHNVRAFFTDGEELGWNTGVNEQGAFGIASTFKRLGITNDDVYVFDACGRGDIPVLSRTVLSKNAPKKFCAQFFDLFERTQNLLRSACPERWMSLPVPYSDNASFLACGIPAVALTMLPADEASLYAHEIMTNPRLEDMVLNRESSKQERLASNSVEYSYKERLPLTWRLFHSEKDDIPSLTENSFFIMAKILDALAVSKTPC
ncbi:MAG: M28 family peptidase [Treponema sp.]|nr:M28 family peptidase [Treponema sp.]